MKKPIRAWEIVLILLLVFLLFVRGFCILRAAGTAIEWFVVEWLVEAGEQTGVLHEFPNGYFLCADISSVSFVKGNSKTEEIDETIIWECITDYCYNDQYVCVKRTVLHPWRDVPEECKHYIIFDFQQSIKYDACDTAEEFEALCEELGITDLCEWIACS